MSWAWLWMTWTFFSAINVYKQNRESIRIGLENKKCVAEVINEIYAIRGNNLSIIMGFISNPRRAINRERGASDWLYGCFGSTLPVPAHRNGRPKCMFQLLSFEYFEAPVVLLKSTDYANILKNYMTRLSYGAHHTFVRGFHMFVRGLLYNTGTPHVYKRRALWNDTCDTVYKV